MSRVSREQVEQARSVDLLTYLMANEPQELRRSGLNEYRTVTHSSLVISNGKWIWNRSGIGGRSALDYLIKVRGMGFIEAVEQICHSKVAPSLFQPTVVALPSSNHIQGGSAVSGHVGQADQLSLPLGGAAREPPRQLILPKVSRYGTHAINYLQRRGISTEVIKRCMQAGILYGGHYRGELVCVFVGRDEQLQERFAAMRGTRSSLKQDCSGSDKRYSFHLRGEDPHSRQLAVFESPIDLLSHATLQEMQGWPWKGHRLSLSGTVPTALIAFLERHPQIKRVVLHLDNDAAGITSARKMKALLAADPRFRRMNVAVKPPRGAKDVNEVLLHYRTEEQEQQKQTGRFRAAGFAIERRN